ncbi:MAG: carnitine dehydratase, partial [Pelagerythrobacter marensis]
SISGYGEDGPMAARKAYDLLIQAESGLSSITGGPDGPARVGVSIVDIATGATAHAAILEALIGRGITGRGTAISVSMFDVMADWLTVPLMNHEAGRSPQRLGLAHPSIAPYGVFTTADGVAILMSIQSDREFASLARRFEFASLARRFLDDPAMAADPRFATNVARVRHRAETDAAVAAAFARRTGAEAVAALTAADVAFAAVNDMAGLAAHRFAGADRRYGPVPGLPQTSEKSGRING